MALKIFNCVGKELVEAETVYSQVLEIADEDTAIFAAHLRIGRDKLAEARADAIVGGKEKLAYAKQLMEGSTITFTNTIDFEAFAPGTWNGMQFKRADVEEIAQNFKALAPYHKVPLKIGHNTDQPLTDGQPALGWVQKAWVDDTGKLMLRASDVPDVVKKAITSKLYRKVSIELDIDVEHKGKKYNYVLSAVALLGADLPAVNTLADLDHYVGQSVLAASRRSAFSAVQGNLTKEDKQMDKAEIEALIANAIKPVAAQTATLTAENERLKAENAKFAREKEETEARAKAATIKLARDNLTNMLEAAVRQQIITPGQREVFTKNFGVNDDDRVTKIDPKDFATMISGGKQLNLSTSTAKEGQEQSKSSRKFNNVDDEINYRVNAEITKSGAHMDYARGLHIVLQADPELAHEYINGNAA